MNYEYVAYVGIQNNMIECLILFNITSYTE